MHIHILGICGTFMGSLAQLAVQRGIRVTGCDQNVYPPMSDQLQAVGIELIQGYEVAQLELKPDLWVIGNAMSRGNPLVEEVLNKNLPYTSGPEFLANHVLQGKWVMAVSGTHGKTSTTSMLAWVLEYAGFHPGFLIGGVPANFGQSARLGESDFFVIEADEYDSAFFDKRSKFVHYHPRTLIINNLEFDHADIFSSLEDIQRQFHHLVRTVPEQGQIICQANEQPVEQVLAMGCWTSVQTLGFEGERAGAGAGAGKSSGESAGDWQALPKQEDCSEFDVKFGGEHLGVLRWNEFGIHSMKNGLGVIAAARSVGIEPRTAIEALSEYKGVKRRMEIIGRSESVTIYDDFAHHPTAIATTLDGLRKRVGQERIVAVIEPRSNTMKAGVHRQELASSARDADMVFWYQPDSLGWSLEETIAAANNQYVEADFDELLGKLETEAKTGGHVVIMSNGGFGGLHQKLLHRLKLL